MGSRTPMRLLGWLAVLGMLSLSSPGVTWVRAQEVASPSAVLPPGPACQALPEGEVPRFVIDSAELGRRVAELTPPRHDVVTLNTAGISSAEPVRRPPIPRQR